MKLEIHPSGYLIIGNSTGCGHLYDIKSLPKVKQTLLTHPFNIFLMRAFSFSKDGSMIICSSDDGNITLFELKIEKEAEKVEKETDKAEIKDTDKAEIKETEKIEKETEKIEKETEKIETKTEKTEEEAEKTEMKGEGSKKSEA